MTEEKEKTKSGVSRREFIAGTVGSAAVLGAMAALAPGVTAAKSFAPHLTAAGEKLTIPVAQAQNAVTSIPSSWDYNADVVCVGDGFGGTCAAIAAYDAGASVLILEKAPQGLDGGNSGVCGGEVTVVHPLTDFITLVNMMCYGNTPLDVVTTFCTEATNLPNWVSSLGGKLNTTSSTVGTPPSFFSDYVSTAFQDTVNPIVVPSFSYRLKTSAYPTGSNGEGKDLWSFFDYMRTQRNIPVLYQTPAKQLIQNPATNEILGVVATNWTGQDINVRANKAVILACGGYQNNPEIRANFGLDTPLSVLTTFYGTPYNTGDGIYMTEAVGAKLWHMNKKECYWLACKPGSEQVGVGLALSGIGKGLSLSTTCPVIYVNRTGSRFMNEYLYSGHSNRTMPYDAYLEEFTSPDGVNFCDWPNIPFYAVFDSKAMAAGPFVNTTAGTRYVNVHNLYSWSADNSVELAKGWIIGPADTPAHLGAMVTCRDFFGKVVGMDSAGLDAQVTAYNNMCTAGVDTQFGRAKTTLLPLANPPFYAMELAECQTNTDGGPAHDKYARTLDVNNNPIPRLYTPGELGSMWGGLYYGGGNAPEAICMGRVAGAQAATLPSWT